MKRLMLICAALAAAAAALAAAACSDRAPGRAPPQAGDVQLPHAFPRFPTYPSAQLVGSAATVMHGKRVLLVTYETPDSVEAVQKWYSGTRFAGFDVAGGDKTPESPLRLRDSIARVDIQLVIGALSSGSGASIQLRATPDAAAHTH
jgi:ABC-type amino acid transport substrate-binding protein